MYVLAAAPTNALLEVGKRSAIEIMQTVTSNARVQVFINGLGYNDVGSDRTRAAYTPENYRQLIALKNKYDQQNIFRFNYNISPSDQPHRQHQE